MTCKKYASRAINFEEPLDEASIKKKRVFSSFSSKQKEIITNFKITKIRDALKKIMKDKQSLDMILFPI